MVSQMSRLCSSLLVAELVEVDFFAGDLAGFGVIVDLCNLLWFLRPLQIERWHDIFGWNDIFFVVSLLRSFGCDLDLFSRFLLPLRSASRRLGGLHIAIGECLNQGSELRLVVGAGFAVVEFLFAVDELLEMPAQLGDAFAKVCGGLHGNITARNIASVANRCRHDCVA
jgi:hypothetical protein